MHNVIFYSDSSVFGGNEQMAIRAHQAIRRFDCRLAITWIVSTANQRLISALDVAHIDYCALALEPAFRPLRNPLTVLRKIRKASQAIRASQAGLVLLLQGWILDGFDGVPAARLAGVPYCSYIPITHTPVELGEGRFPALRTASLSLFFRSIPRYITIDEQQAIRLRRWNPRANIAVVENYAPRPSSPLPEPAQPRSLEIPLQSTVIAVIGRISFRQKAQDWWIDSLAADPILRGKTVLFIGDGPDIPALAEKIRSSPWRGNIHILGWREDLDRIYPLVDLLIIPSRSEGVPLVMIEALARHIPVIGSDRDGMRSWLPPEWRFPFGDVSAMKQAIVSALGDPPVGYWEAADRRLDAATDEQRFASQFADALIACCQSPAHSRESSVSASR